MSATTAISRTMKLHRYLRRINHRHFTTSPSQISPLLSLRGQQVNSFGLYKRRLFSALRGRNIPAAAAKVKAEKSSSSSSGNDDDAGKHVRRSPVSWMSFFLLVVTGAGIIFYYDRKKKRHIEEVRNASNTYRQDPSARQVAIGGEFKLITHEGKNVTDKDFLGKWTLLYFGFTHCPDICPGELRKLAAAVDKIKKKSAIEIVPVFVSVDPERDSVEQVNKYVKEFHPKMIGLTGDPKEIRKVASAYRVYYMKTTEDDSDYLIDHSTVTYLMSPQMDFVKFYGKSNDIDGLVNGILKEVKQYKK